MPDSPGGFGRWLLMWRRSVFVLLGGVVLLLIFVLTRPKPQPTVVPALLEPSAGTLLDSSSLTLVGSAQPNSLVEVWIDGLKVSLIASDEAGRWRAEVNLSGPGDHLLQLKAVDADRNLLAESEEFSLSVKGPPLSSTGTAITAPPDGSTLGSGIGVFSGTGPVGRTVAVLVEERVVGRVPVRPNGRWTFAYDFRQSGEYNVRARAIDLQQNILSESNIVRVRVPEASIGRTGCPCTLRLSTNAPEATFALRRESGEVVSSRSSSYVAFTNLPTATYRYTVEAPGFKSHEGTARTPDNRALSVWLEPLPKPRQ
ncbi:hypothetical protein Mrose_00695 [Calidithermus roseus]|uniref:Bacterial Ig-like domain-containing protein n=2 Tax=Calidithermus roseus TaxID=1644118 RepID=A0A399F1H5_9DEIN|nr:hypothetical protein Mrose_00695 [Calidithermus roseus]